MTALLVVGIVVGLVVAVACLVVLGLAIRAGRADKTGRERSNLAGAPERLGQRDLPDLDTRQISRKDLP